MTTDTTPAAIEALMTDVTEGPWDFIKRPNGSVVVLTRDETGNPKKHVAEMCWSSMKGGDKDARFIAAARDLVPALAAELATARAERDEARKEVERLREVLKLATVPKVVLPPWPWHSPGHAGTGRCCVTGVEIGIGMIAAEPLGLNVTTDDFPCQVCGDDDPLSQANCAMNGCSAKADDFGGEA